MISWATLDDELARWRDDGRAPKFWWRDDDAVRATEPLDRLLTLGDLWRVPISLAVIPGLADQSLADNLTGRVNVSALQHGFRHINHATGGDKKSELGAHRPLDHIIGDLNDGQAIMNTLFPDITIPVLVPPWNRIDEHVIAKLPTLGFGGISRFRARTSPEAFPDLAQVNTHVDIIDWHGGRGYRGDQVVLGDLCEHLAAQRRAIAEFSEPIGLLTHHLDHDEDSWNFVEMLLERTAADTTGAWKAASEIFPSHMGLQ